MASVINRGTRTRPRWVAKVRDSEGMWRTVTTRQLSRADAMRVAKALEARSIREGVGLEKPTAPPAPLCGPLLERWISGDIAAPGKPRAWGGLTNRAARGDSLRVRRHLIPRFAAVRLDELTPQFIMRWLAEMKATGDLAESTQRVNLHLLSRFCSWTVVQGLSTSNPVRAVPSNHRPQQTPKADEAPWLKDDATVVALMRALPTPFNLLLYLTNRSGMRPGEVCGLRMGDLGRLADGWIIVRHSYAGPLKEDRGRGPRKAKKAPAPADHAAVLGPWLRQRRADGAGDDALVFPRRDGKMLNYSDIWEHWRRACAAVGVRGVTFKAAGRHSFASRNLEAGELIADVARAMGNGQVIASRHYDRHLPGAFPPGMHAPLSTEIPIFVSTPTTREDA